MKKYSVSNECISCRACVEVASNNFEIGDDNIAYLKKQPVNENQNSQCQQAMDICPVSAISADDVDMNTNSKAVVASSNIKETLDEYPELKQVLIELSPKFKRMQSPALYNTLARFANFGDAAKVVNLSVCEILHTINAYLGTEKDLLKRMPECIHI